MTSEHRPSAGQLAAGTLIAVLAAVALLAVSGETGVWRIAVLVAFAVALGTLSTALLVSAAHRRPEPRGQQGQREQQGRPTAGSAVRQQQPVYAHQSR